MLQPRTRLVRTTLTAMRYSGLDRLLAPWTRGVGVIFTLHRVSGEPPAAFSPNRILEVTPEFLERTIRHVQEAGLDIVSLDEAHFRLTEGDPRRFACFTFDDGYRDNRDLAYPIFKHYGLPFTIYLPTDYVDGHGQLWWLELEQAILWTHRVTVRMRGEARVFPTETVEQKWRAFEAIYWWLREEPEAHARQVVRELCWGAGYDVTPLCRQLIMDWDEVRAMAADPLVTFGAHTKSHRALAKLPPAEARAEIEDSVARLEAVLARPCNHFAFPYGDEASAGEREFAICRELGLSTAMTTRKGLIHSEHGKRTTGLPRLPLNGDYQDIRYLDVLMTGAPFALGDAVGRLLPRRSAA
jgi:peptidoglycan/xylan/chitin deacetylase (PgdA/CDA1 family)